MSWIVEYAAKFSQRIISGKLAHSRVATMTGLPLTHAKALALYARCGTLPDPPLPDPSVTTPEPAIATVEDPVDVNGSEYLHDTNYVYNPDKDTYVTFIPGIPKPIVLPGEVHREILRAYSNFDGNPASINEIARSVRLPRAWVVKYLRVHGITHDKEPFTSEEILSRSDDQLVEDGLQLRRATLYKKLEKAKWADIQNDAMKWRDVEDHLFRTIEAGLKHRKQVTVPTLNLVQPEHPFCAVVGLSDFHWGKYGDPAEVGEAYNRRIAKHRLFDATETVFAQVARLGRPDKLIVPIGSDFFQVDNQQSQSTKGTPQDMDGSPAEMLVSGCRLMEDWINQLRQVAPVELVLMSGNHDRMLGLALLLYLEATFRSAPDVTVRLDRTPRVYRTYGRNLIGFVHGDGVSKTTDMVGHMAREAALDWGACPHKTIYTGHFHHEKTETDTAFGVTRRQLPSLSGSDRWHALHGFVGAPKSMPVYLHDKNRGLVAVLHSPVE